MAARAPRAPRAPQSVVPVAAPSRRAKIAVAAAPAESGRKRVIPEGATDDQKRLFRNAVITAKRRGATIDEANALALSEVFGAPKAAKAPKASKAVAPVAPAAAPKASRASRKAPEAAVSEKPKARRSKASSADVPGEHTFVLTVIGLDGTKVISASSFEELAEKFNKN